MHRMNFWFMRDPALARLSHVAVADPPIDPSFNVVEEGLKIFGPTHGSRYCVDRREPGQSDFIKARKTPIYCGSGGYMGNAGLEASKCFTRPIELG